MPLNLALNLSICARQPLTAAPAVDWDAFTGGLVMLNAIDGQTNGKLAFNAGNVSDAYDQTDNGNDANQSNASLQPAYSTGGAIAYIQCAASRGLVFASQLSLTTDFLASFLVIPDSTTGTGNAGRFTADTADNDNGAFGVTRYKAHVGLGGGLATASWVWGGGLISADWHVVTFQKDGATMTVFLDGASEGNMSVTAGATAAVRSIAGTPGGASSNGGFGAAFLATGTAVHAERPEIEAALAALVGLEL